MRKQRIKNIFLIVFLLTLGGLFANYRKEIVIAYSEINTRIGDVLSSAVIICISALFSILVCYCVGKCRDKKFNNSGSFSSQHPYLNMIIGLALIIIIGAIGWVAVYYIGLFLGRGINVLVNWTASMASKLDAVVIVALITGAVSIVGVIISSIVAKIIDYRKNRQDYLAKKREVPYGEW